MTGGAFRPRPSCVQASAFSAASSHFAIASASRAFACSWRAVARPERSASPQCEGSASSSSISRRAPSAASASRSSFASCALRFLLGPGARRGAFFGRGPRSASDASLASRWAR